MVVKVANQEPDGAMSIGIGKLGIAFVMMILAISAAITPVMLLVARMSMHIGDTGTHETVEQHSDRIDRRHNMLMAPMMVELDHIKGRLDDIHTLVRDRNSAGNKPGAQ